MVRNVITRSSACSVSNLKAVSVPKSMSVLSVFATVFTSEIFSNFNWNALKSPNISAHGGTAHRGLSEQAGVTRNIHVCLTKHLTKKVSKPLKQ